ncbi:MAG: hypothetical protein HPY85_10985 [Anaerolineae bacterium]|nr:hypothetical protein [Anaerolineae bacterium]
MIKRKHASGFNAIFADPDKAPLDQIMDGFDFVTRTIIEQSDKDIELNRALGDAQAVIREQVKRSTIIHARSILNTCAQRATGKEVYDDYLE